MSTPRAATVSSVRPSAAVADERIVWLIVSPVVSAAAMIAVPSIEPGDDQRAAGRTPADVPHAEAEEHPVAQTEHRDDEQGGHESSDDDGEQASPPGCRRRGS